MTPSSCRTGGPAPSATRVLGPGLGRGPVSGPVTGPSYLRYHHSLADVHTRPAHLHHPVGVVEQAHRDGLEVVGAVRRGHFEGVPAAGQGGEGVHLHHERVRDGWLA